jgi:polysaccharide export outer membrane protein
LASWLTSGASDRPKGRERRLRSWLAVAAAAWFCIPSPGESQSASFDPFGSSSGNSNASSGATSGDQGGQSSGASGLGSFAGASASSLYGSAAGQTQSGAMSDQIGPTTIPNVPSMTESGENLTPITRPTAQGASPAPLFLRAGSAPGQFELFTRPPPQPSEFEAFILKTLGRPLPRFGASLILNGGRGFASPPTTAVPPDYVLSPGDELLIGITGSVEAQLRLKVDSQGQIFVPKIGAINVAGVRYGDLAAALSRRVDEQYKQAKLSVVIGRLHGLTVYVTGYAVSPGSYTLNSLSTMVDAVLAAGGPAAGGSFRSVRLVRNGQTVTDLDLYDLLLRGDKSHDVILQDKDVLNIAPVGPELAVTGSVNAAAIYEAKRGETVADVIRFAGGVDSLADDSRMILVRLGDLDAAGSQQISFAQAMTFPAERGEIVRILSLANVARPQERQAILATIEGEVDHPGRYYLPPGSTLADLLAKSGGLTQGAFIFGTDFVRESVRRQQQQSFDRAIEDLELDAAAAPIGALNGSPDLAASAPARTAATNAVIDRLRERKPDGRFILDIGYNASSLPGGLALEDDDRIYIPPRPKTVGVFGAVYQAGSFRFDEQTRLSDYLKRAGGPRKIADKGEIFVVRADGAVLSSQQAHGFGDQPALPGDVIFVPVRTSPGLFEKIREISTVVYQLGIGAATLGILAAQF